ncbi:MAG: hypothetical protein K0U71_07575 [Actinomycetia bacterium]|nr:hypothetical protein [Actinomycetes bacterium]
MAYDRAGRRIPVIIDGEPAAAMIPHLQLQKVKVISTAALDIRRTCGGFWMMVQQLGRRTPIRRRLFLAVEGAGSAL